jgi:hypothetical protein
MTDRVMTRARTGRTAFSTTFAPSPQANPKAMENARRKSRLRRIFRIFRIFPIRAFKLSPLLLPLSPVNGVEGRGEG